MYFSIMIVAVSTLSIAFVSGMIQSMRTRKLIQRVIKSLKKKYLIKVNGKKKKKIKTAHVVDYIDSIVEPTINRVAPLGRFVYGIDSFKGDKKISGTRKFIGLLTYSIFKLFAFAVVVLTPLYSILYGLFEIQKFPESGILPLWVLWIVSSSAFLALLFYTIADIKHVSSYINRALS